MTWGPDGRQIAACVTFDHLGEAADLGAGRLPADSPVGHHHSVDVQLPEVLAMLEGRANPVTFYVEGWNWQTYPNALHSIVDAGHELGWHGWVHEPWYSTTPEVIADSLTRSLASFESVGLRPLGARPPAGLLGEHSIDLLRDAGFEWVSLAGPHYGLQDGMPLLPYPWKAIDGDYYIPGFSGLRVPPGDAPVGPEELLVAYDDFMEETIAIGGFASFVFHVLWQDTPERIAAIATLMDRLSADDRVWSAQSGQVAAWMRDHPSDFPSVQHVDEAPGW